MSLETVLYTSLFSGSPGTDDDSLTLLRVGSFVLLLALTVVIVVLMYFVKKKVYLTNHHTHTQTYASTDTWI